MLTTLLKLAAMGLRQSALLGALTPAIWLPLSELIWRGSIGPGFIAGMIFQCILGAILSPIAFFTAPLTIFETVQDLIPTRKWGEDWVCMAVGDHGAMQDIYYGNASVMPGQVYFFVALASIAAAKFMAKETTFYLTSKRVLFAVVLFSVPIAIVLVSISEYAHAHWQGHNCV